MQQQNIEGLYCMICKKRFKFYSTLERHRQTHSLFCAKCERSFKNPHQKKLHEKAHHPQIKQKKCGVCPELSFNTEEEYLLHIRDVHKGKFVNCYMCSECGRTFKTRSVLNQHINSKCGTEKKYMCKVCGQQLMTPGSLYNHMRRHNDRASVMCRFCAKLFLTVGQLKVHERIHTQQKDFVCHVCGKGFCHRQSLITHSSVHTGIKPYQCEGCGKSFSCVGNLLKHRKTHADSCGLLPLTTHRVQNPSTKIKVKINTPESSRLKNITKKKELEEKFAKLDSKLISDSKMENSQNDSNQEIIDPLFIQQNQSDVVQETLLFDTSKGTTNTIDQKVENLTDNIYLSIKDEDSSTDIDTKNDMENNTELKETCTVDSITNVIDTSSKKIDKKPYRRKRDYLFDSRVDTFIKERKLENVKIASCKYCHKEYTQFRWLYKHEKEHEGKDVSNNGEVKSMLFKCSCCNKFFETSEEVKQHQHLMHLDVLNMESLTLILNSGFDTESRNQVFNKYPVEDISCTTNTKKNSVLIQFQNQVAHGLVALDRLFHRCAREKTFQVSIKEEVVDSIKIFSDLYYQLSLNKKFSPYSELEDIL